MNSKRLTLVDDAIAWLRLEGFDLLADLLATSHGYTIYQEVPICQV